MEHIQDKRDHGITNYQTIVLHIPRETSAPAASTDTCLKKSINPPQRWGNERSTFVTFALFLS